MANNKAENPKTEKPEKKDDGMVELFIPRKSGNGEPNEFISINGKNWILPRGKVSRVPQCVYDEYHRADDAENHMEDNSDRMAEESTIGEINK